MRYPVIVTVELTHIIWVEGVDQDGAFEYARRDTHEKINDQETLAEYSMTVRKPGDDFHSYDWDTIRDGDHYMPYQGTPHDAHVEARDFHLLAQRLKAEQLACVEQGHPNLKHYTYHDGSERWYCPTHGCGYFDTHPAQTGDAPAAEPAAAVVGGAR